MIWHEIINLKLNNRELSLAFWLVCIFFFCLYMKQTRELLKKLIKFFFNWKIQLWILLMSAYITLIVYGLFTIDLWNPSQLKDTISWFLLSGTYTGFQVATDNGEKPFRKILLESLGLIVVIEYLVGLYTFSFVVEVLIQPFMAIVVGMEIMLKREERTIVVAKLMNWIQVIFGLVLIWHTISSLLADEKGIDKIVSLRSFIFPIILTFLFIPFLYFQKLAILYESLFTRLNYGSDINKDSKRKIKYKLLLIFNINYFKLDNFQKFTIGKWLNFENYNSFTQLIQNFKKDQSLEKNK